MHNYNCHTCQEPMKVTLMFQSYVRLHGSQRQKCYACGAIHEVAENNKISLLVAGTPMAKLSQEYAFPEYAPYRVGAYRVRYSTGNWSKVLIVWDGEHWHNGPIVFATGSIISWQGLAGDMEHLKRMPYDLVAPIVDSTVPECDE